MKSWIHEISESYVSGYKPVRKDLKENYTSLTEEEISNLFSNNILNYIDEQLQNAYGIDVNELQEQEKQELNEGWPLIVKGIMAAIRVARAAKAFKTAGKAASTASKVTTAVNIAGDAVQAGRGLKAAGKEVKKATKPQLGPGNHNR